MIPNKIVKKYACAFCLLLTHCSFICLFALSLSLSLSLSLCVCFKLLFIYELILQPTIHDITWLISMCLEHTIKWKVSTCDRCKVDMCFSNELELCSLCVVLCHRSWWRQGVGLPATAFLQDQPRRLWGSRVSPPCLQGGAPEHPHLLFRRRDQGTDDTLDERSLPCIDPTERHKVLYKLHLRINTICRVVSTVHEYWHLFVKGKKPT